MGGARACRSSVAVGCLLVLLLSITGEPVSAFFPAGGVFAGQLTKACKKNGAVSCSGQFARGGTKLAVSSAAEGSSSTASSVTAEEAKRNLRRALDENNGSALAKDVAAAIEVLEGLNPTASPGRAWPLLSGDWVSIGQHLTGTKRTDDGVECTLGLLTFFAFQPTNLPVLLTSITTTVGPDPSTLPETASDPKEQQQQSTSPSASLETVHNVVTRFEARDGSGLKGRAVVRGVCAADPEQPQRLQVRYMGGSIEPDDGQDLAAWRAVIGRKPGRGDANKGPRRLSLPWLKEKALGLVFKLTLGVRSPPPGDETGARGELSYTMPRAPKGWIDILYLDEEMRVTRGNRGAVIVVTRS